MTQQIVVIGAGYGGLSAAMRLARKTDAHITLINPVAYFVERVRLHQEMTGQHVAYHPIARMVEQTGAAFIEGYVTAIQPDIHQVRVATQAGIDTLAYDILVYAPGSQTDLNTIPGVRAFATIPTPDAVARLQPTLAALPGGAQIVVCGGGLTGIETATEIAETYPQLSVHLVTRGAFGHDLSAKGRAHVRRVFDRLGIRVHDGHSVTRITADAVETDAGSFPYAAVLWAGAFTTPTLARNSGIVTNAANQVVVDRTLRSVSQPDIYAIGDAATITDFAPHIRMACATTLPTASYVANAIAARQRGQQPKPYRFRYYLRCISLGRQDGLIQIVRGDDTPREWVITGRQAAWVKEQVCRFAFGQALGGRASQPPAAIPEALPQTAYASTH